MVTTATAASPFFACEQLRDKRCCWPFENTFVLWKHCRFGPLKLGFPPSLRHVVELYAVLVLASGLSWKWKFSSARFQLRYRWQYGLEVYLLTWEEAALLGKLGSLSVHGEIEMQGKELHTPWTCWFVRILPPRYLLKRPLANFSVSHERLDFVFHDQWSKYFYNKKVCNKQKCFFFSDYRLSFRVAYFSNLYPWQSNPKGLSIVQRNK